MYASESIFNCWSNLTFYKKIEIKFCHLHVHVPFVTFISMNIVNKEESLLYKGNFFSWFKGEILVTFF